MPPSARVRDATEGKKAETTGSGLEHRRLRHRAHPRRPRKPHRHVPVVNESRVEAVRRAVDEGRYHVDPQRVADKMMRFEVDLLATIPAHK